MPLFEDQSWNDIVKKFVNNYDGQLVKSKQSPAVYIIRNKKISDWHITNRMLSVSRLPMLILHPRLTR